jgi:hypothetical protein
MPTTTVLCPAIALPQKRRIAKELAFWWRRAGVDVNHAITRFTETAADSVYSGPLPMTGAPFAFVHCVVAADRDTEFKARYAAQVRQSLAEIAPAERVFVSFQPTDPTDHFVAVRDDPTEEGTA